ncbi:hypothetical protein DPX16_12773 [Anabarilius grahami]|uniref:Uncharacterized protein n=1 Tax=Anabarilius grahami TaxID=495550 RepID=A0A3N0Z9H3_ANAGA|nr:hypothetical protein DPX16_12773 [Anabarilius grahami]
MAWQADDSEGAVGEGATTSRKACVAHKQNSGGHYQKHHGQRDDLWDLRPPNLEALKPPVLGTPNLGPQLGTYSGHPPELGMYSHDARRLWYGSHEVTRFWHGGHDVTRRHWRGEYCGVARENTPSIHLEEFLDLAHQTTFPDDCLCTFLHIGLNTTTQAQLSREPPQGSFSVFVEWVLASCGSSFTVDDVTSPTPNLVPSQNPSVVIKQYEPTTDVKPFVTASPCHQGCVKCARLTRCACRLHHPPLREPSWNRRARSLILSPQPFLPPTRHHFPPIPLYPLLSVVWIHLGPAGNHLRLSKRSP